MPDKLLDLIDVDGAIVTADAMSCQKKIVEKITGRNADYTIGLKHALSQMGNNIYIFIVMFYNIKMSKTH